MNSQDFFIAIVRHVLAHIGSGEDAILACMIMLHTQDILPSETLRLDDVTWPATAPHQLSAITQRHASELVAAVIGQGAERVAHEWYYTYCEKAPYQTLEEVSQPMLTKVQDVIECVLQHPLVESVVDAE